MEKISIVRRRHRSRDLETAALVRARMREQNGQVQTLQMAEAWTQTVPAPMGAAEEFCFEVELTPEQVNRLQQQRRNGSGGSTQASQPVIFRFNITQPTSSETLTSREVCRVLKISRRTLYRYVKSGDLPAFRVGGGLRFLRQDVLRFLGQCRIPSSQP